MRSRRSSWVALGAAVVLAAGALTATAPPASATGTTRPTTSPTTATQADATPLTLPGAVPSWAKGTPLATLAAGSDVDFVVQLAPRHAAELAQLAHDVNDPASPSYHHYLTAAQYAATYGPTPAAVGTVRSVLTAAGLSIDTVTDRGTYLAVHGPASAVGALFGTTFGTFRVGGLTLRSPLSTPVIPAALRGLVANVAGLAQSPPLRPTHVLAEQPDTSPVFLNARPCSDYYGEKTASDAPAYHGEAMPYSVCGYTGATLRKAYGLDRTGLTGKGATIGIVDAFASPTILEDANTYATRHGEEPFAEGQFTENIPVGVQEIPEDPTGLGLIDPDGWAGEETLDVEAAHSMAPDADIVYQSGLTPYGPMLYLGIAALVEQGKVQVISDSFGTADDSPLPTDKLLLDQITTQAAAQGITIAFSSGDDGDETDPAATGERTGDFPATSDGVVAVGGTTLAVGADGGRQWETYWGTDKYLENADGTGWDLDHYTFGGAGGGGVSTSYAEPDWQKGVVPDDLATYGGVPAGRVVPDLSLVGDPTTGFLMGQTQQFPDGSVKYSEYRIGGTSLSCPLFAGLLALAVEEHGGAGLGLVTPTLYRASATADGLASLFNDPVAADVADGRSTLANVRSDYTDPSDAGSPVVASLRTLGNLATLHALPGYDDSTGLGSPKAAALVAVLNGEPVPADSSGDGSGGTTPPTTAPTPPAKVNLRLGRIAVHRHGRELVAAVTIRNLRNTAVPAVRLVARAAGVQVAGTRVEGLAGHTARTVRLAWRPRGAARWVTIVDDPAHRLHQVSREGDRRTVQLPR